jgi:hypothetical protein
MASHPDDQSGASALYAALTHKWDAKTIDSFASALENRDAKATDGTTAAFQTIDVKATGLLTHVSMMIAGLAICAPLVAQHELEEVTIIFEISVYLLIAVGCLRCLSVVRSLHTHKPGDDLKQSVQRELILRHELYRVCNKATIYFTIFVFFSLPVMLWWK